MKIELENVPKKYHKKLTKAIEFYAQCLMPADVIDNLLIDIEFSKKIESGQCVNEDEGRDPRWFTIHLNPNEGKLMYRTLAHEMVHVKQYAMNEMKVNLIFANESISLRTTWKRKEWKPSDNEHVYFDSPWEIEAFGREIGLFLRFCDLK